ncbi:hypothetical protein N431DRAFT_551691 [Stipitochalara longipes BDJ]|nr:hypothetical protein N431DRAFT_551691 [Stipitochalara longipes BDJ]
MPYQSLSLSKMLFSVLAIILSLAPQSSLAHNQRAAPSTTSSAPAATHSINVGADGLRFEPDSVVANVGDTILFRFYPQNHSVARADYMSPCIPYELTGAGRVGFWSGFQPTNVVLSNPPTFSVLVNDTSPIFFYCSAPGACIQDGMVGVINPNSTQTLATQKAYAENSTLALSPGQGFPAEGTPSAAAIKTSNPSSASPLSGGAIAGIVIGAAAVLLFGAALVYFCGRQRTVKEILQTQSMRGPSSYHPGSEHMSLASSAGYLPKYPHGSIAPMGPLSFSGQGGLYDHPLGVDTGSYRSRSPPPDETMDTMMSHIDYSGTPGTMTPSQVESPLTRSRTNPPRPRRSSQPMPIMEGTIYQPITADVPTALRFNRAPSQTGPHELSGVNENENAPPFPPPRNPNRGSSASNYSPGLI